jgi:hypothetical protein
MSARKSIQYSREEDAALVEGWKAKLTPKQMAERGVVDRSVGSIKARMWVLNLLLNHTNETTLADETTKTIRDDNAFIAVMHAAIAKGQEHPPVGIFKDDSPLVGKKYQPEPAMSCCGSQASLCADQGDRWTSAS